MKSLIKIFFMQILVLPGVMVYAQIPQAADKVYEIIAVNPKPVIIRDQQPVYPQNAINAGIEGTVVVRVIIDLNGNVSNAEIMRSITQLDNAALIAARGKVFSPGEVNGTAVRTRMNIPINFILPDLAPDVAPPSPGGEDIVDLTGQAVIIKVEPDRPRVNIFSDRIKPEFGNIDLDKSFMPELLGRAERIEIVPRSKEEELKPIDAKQVVNRSR
jgi:protein TonB